MPTITNMTALALATHPSPPSSPTYLYLNFDGWTNCPTTSSSIAAYTGSAQNINDILFQVSEIYAPFDVVVEQIHGNGVYDKTSAVAGGPPPTTIFIGGNPNNESPTGKIATSFTPGQFVDSPTASNPSHVPHSDPYNLAFVDPVSITSGNGSTPWNGNYPWVQIQSDAVIAEGGRP